MRIFRATGPAFLALVLAAGPSAAQTDGLVATCDGSAIGVSFSSTYFQDGPPIAFLWRRDLTDCGAWTVAGGPWFPAPGQLLQIGITDTAVSPGHLYEYWLGFAAGSGRDTSADGPLITLYRVYGGCGQVPVASGVLRSQVSEEGLRYIFPFTCPGLCYPTHVIWNTAIDLSPYVDTEVPIQLEGSIYFYWQWGWVLQVTAAEPRDCSTLAVEQVPWTRMKQMYRD